MFLNRSHLQLIYPQNWQKIMFHLTSKIMMRSLSTKAKMKMTPIKATPKGRTSAGLLRDTLIFSSKTVALSINTMKLRWTNFWKKSTAL